MHANGFCIKKVDNDAVSSEKAGNINNCYSILYILNGIKKYFINNSLYIAHKGDMILIDATDICTERTMTNEKEGSCIYYVIDLSPEHIALLSDKFDTDMLTNPFAFKKIVLSDNESSRFKDLMDLMYKEYEEPDNKHSGLLIDLYTVELLICLDRLSSGKELSEDISVQEERICCVCTHICNYYNEQIHLRDMAKMAYMSPTYFSKKFKSVTGFGFNEYLNNVRTKIAINMLLNTRHSITQIAMYCGYQDPNYFGDVFRRIVGISPSKYRKTYSK